MYKVLYNDAMLDSMEDEKPIEWVPGSREDLRSFPDDARREAGFQLDKVQHGEEPDRYKWFTEIGPGVKEIIIDEDADAFRVMYVAKFTEAVYVLHAFQKKTQKTSKQDKDTAKARYKLVLERRKNSGY